MADIVLTRTTAYVDGVLGQMRFPYPDMDHIQTLEPVWKDNIRNESCIPVGRYKLEPCPPTRRFAYPHLRLLCVLNRSGILVHVGNYPQDTTGCILVGESRSDAGPEVYSSKVAMTRCMDYFGQLVARSGRVEHHLIIEEEVTWCR